MPNVENTIDEEMKKNVDLIFAKYKIESKAALYEWLDAIGLKTTDEECGAESALQSVYCRACMDYKSVKNKCEAMEEGGEKKTGKEALSPVAEEGRRQRKQSFYGWLASIGVKIKPVVTAAECHAERVLLTMYNIYTDCTETHTEPYIFDFTIGYEYDIHLLRTALNGNKVIPDEALPHLVRMAQIHMACLLFHIDKDELCLEPITIITNLNGLIFKYSELYDEYDFVKFRQPESDTIYTISYFFTCILSYLPPKEPDQRRLATLSTLSSVELAELVLGVTIFAHMRPRFNLTVICSDPFIYIDDDPQKSEEERECCAICMEDFVANEILRRTYCSHKFHRGCIEQASLYTKTCPMCRENLGRFHASAFAVYAMAYSPLLRVKCALSDLFPADSFGHSS